MASPRQRFGSAAIDRLRDVTKRHWPALDAFRGFAILVVVVHNLHRFELTDLPVAQGLRGDLVLVVERSWYHLQAAGWVGVQLFFVLSGFLITGILLDSRDTPGAMKRFLFRRALRIFPLYYVTLFVLLVLVPAGEAVAQAKHDQAYYWLYIENWLQPFGRRIPTLPHFWSLAVEEQFYLLWPLAVLLMSRRHVARVAWAMVVIALASRVYFVTHHWPDAAYQFTTSRFDGLAFGALLALGVRDEGWRARLADLSLRTILAPIAVLVACVVLERGLEWDAPYIISIGHTALSVLFAMLVAYAARPDLPRVVRVVLDGSPLRALGRLSYAVYAFHLPIAYYSTKRAFAIIGPAVGVHRVALSVAYVVVVLAASVALAALSGALLERPLLRLRK